MGLKGVGKRPKTKPELAAEESAQKREKLAAEGRAAQAQTEAVVQRHRDRGIAVENARIQGLDLGVENAATHPDDVIRVAAQQRKTAAFLNLEIQRRRTFTEKMEDLYQSIKKNAFHLERLFAPGPIAGATTDMIAARGWKELAAEQTPVKPSVVWEFYVALAENKKATTITVRGVPVKFSPAAINDVYEIPEVDNSKFLAIRSNPDLEAMLRDLKYPGTKWRRKPGEIFANELSQIGRSWMTLICPSLKYPGTNAAP